jgi:hypothetical protein
MALGLTACSKPAPASDTVAVRFSKVPLEVLLPLGWSQSRNSSQWLVYRPVDGGALAAMTGEKDCSLVEKRLYTAMLDLGLTNVLWSSAPRTTELHGLDATVAEGTAEESGKQARVRYALARAPKRMGCLLTLVTVWEAKHVELGRAADAILESVRPSE